MRGTSDESALGRTHGKGRRRTLRALALLGGALALLGSTTARADEEPYPTNACVAAKQAAAGRYCRQAFTTWATWLRIGQDRWRDNRLLRLADRLDAEWEEAEAEAAAQGSDCAETTVDAFGARDLLDAAVHDVVGDALGGAPGNEAPACGRRLFQAAGRLCEKLLTAESGFVEDPGADEAPLRREFLRERAQATFDAVLGNADRPCVGTPDAEAVAERVVAAVDDLVRDTTVSPHVPATHFATISPFGSVAYQGRDLTPTCIRGTPYHFFAKRGTVNKLVMYYQGGGACWEQLTCTLPTCDASVNPLGGDNPNSFASGFADPANPANPFRDWHVVFVSYCSCDVHYGDAARDYTNVNPAAPLHVEHRGYQNAKVVEKWAREHFLTPDTIFVTGSSAGAYGAIFHGPGLHEAWPAARIHVLGDAGNGVITPQFLQDEFENWNFRANLPADIPGVLESIDEGTGMPAYVDAVAHHFPQTNWAHYTTAFDGGSGGQTGFYHLMRSGNNPLAALAWWEGSCAFNQQMRQQALETASRVPENYRYYIGSGSRHTMWGSNKVYTDTLGGVPTVVDWISAMLRSGPGAPDPGWTNVEASPSNVLLPGDPQPPAIPTLPFVMQGADVVVDCD